MKKTTLYQITTQLILTKNLLSSRLPHDGVTSSITENSEIVNSHEPALAKQKTHFRFESSFCLGIPPSPPILVPLLVSMSMNDFGLPF